MDANEDAIKDRMSRLIEALSKQFPEQAVTTAELWKFAKMHDRRSYQLVRFCIAADSEYRTVIKAIVRFVFLQTSRGDADGRFVTERVHQAPRVFDCSSRRNT